MGRYAVVSRCDESARSEAESHRLRHLARAAGWQVTDLSPDAWIAATGPRPPSSVIAGAWVLIGDVIPRERPRASDIAADIPHAFERKLMARFWGRYVGCRLNGRGRVDALLRDPSGALDCCHWSSGGCVVVSSDWADWLMPTDTISWTIAFDRVAQAVMRPLSVWNALLLEGPNALPAGCIQELTEASPPMPVWRPQEFARTGRYRHLSPSDAATVLEEAIDEAVRGLSQLKGVYGAEISGGLDSSLIAAALKRSGTDVRIWLNAYGPGREGDERSYARRLAEHLDVTPTLIQRPVMTLTEPDLMALTSGFRPGFNALDVGQDQQLARSWAESGVTAVMTGKGGDSILIEAANANVFADLWAKGGWRAIFSPALPGLARWNETSIWSLIQHARRSTRQAEGLSQSPQPLASEQITTGNSVLPHPWLADCEDLGPGKTYQIAGIVNGLTFSGPCAQAEVVDLIHPMLSQPVVETALSMSTPQLTLGRRDRALARAAFQGRIPDLIALRRSKGEITAYYGRRIAASLPVLRPWLLDGCLARHELIDRETMERTLTIEHLIWHGGYAEIMLAVALESWVRTWGARLGSHR